MSLYSSQSKRNNMTAGSSGSSQYSTYSSDEITSLMPNLPGYRPRQPNNPQRKASFDIVNGSQFLKQSAIDEMESHGDFADDSSSSLSIVSTKNKQAVRDFGVILTYKAYFEERPEGIKPGTQNVRECNIHYYLEDDTMKVVEKATLNSATTQGILVKRSILQREDGSPFSLFDLRIGEIVTIFKKDYTIADYDTATRNYLVDMGFDDDEAMPMPKDSYQEYRLQLQKDMDLTKDPNKFKCTKNDNKTFADATKGVLIDNSGREGFMKFGKDTLNFKCIWDNTHQLYGDRLEYGLKYYLADDTIEILSANAQEKVKLLRRSKLPKDFGESMVLGERPKKSEFFQWTDLFIGKFLEVYGRKLRVVDADYFCRSYYEEAGIPLAEPIVQYEPKLTKPVREIPPPTGFGSEEDSMRSVSGSLMPGKPPVKKPGESKIISFFASLLSGGIDDVERRFVLSYYVTDNTLKIQEPPVRNSGFTGGVFLSRRPIIMENGAELKFKDLYIGCKLQVLKHRFLLLDASGSTMKWMEQCMNGQPLPRSNCYAILDKIRPVTFKNAESGSLFELFASEETPEAPGRATIDTLRSVMSRYNLLSDHPDDVSEHEMRTILRGAGNDSPTFHYPTFIQEILNPTDHYK